MEKLEQTTSPHRKLLTAAVSSVLLSHGFDSSDWDVLETLTEMLQCFFCEIGQSSKNYCELSGRTEPLIADVILGFVEMGINFTQLSEFIKQHKLQVLPTLQPQQQPKQLNMLQAGTKQPLPSHIPQHLPSFPDPHSYIRTPTHKQPVIDYEAIREKCAIQKRDVEKALTKFLAKTSQTHNLFENDEFIFPLITCKTEFPPYLNALMPQDQIFDAEDLEYKTEEINPPPKKRVKTEKSETKTEGDGEEEVVEKPPEEIEDPNKVDENSSPVVDIDNPYLAATKLPNKS